MEFFMFTIFEISWFLSARGSVLQVQAKIKIFLKFIHQFYQFENEYLPEYFKNVFIFISRGNQACARIANAKRTTQSRDAELSAIYIEGTRLTFELARSPWQPVRFFENNSEIHDICWGINEQIFPDFMDITVWIWMKLMPKLTLYFVHNVCKWQEFSCFYTAVEAIFSAVCDHFWTKTSFSTSSFWGSNYHFLDDLDYLLCNAGVSFWFDPIEIHFF